MEKKQDVNQIQIIGRLTAVPELKKTPNGVSVAQFCIAVPRKKNREQTDFFTVIAWRGLGENCAKYLSKGQQAAVSGEMQQRKYKDKDGNMHTIWEILAENVEFLVKAKTAAGEEMDAMQQLPEDEDLPF